jgi:hypothetical protein
MELVAAKLLSSGVFTNFVVLSASRGRRNVGKKSHQYTDEDIPDRPKCTCYMYIGGIWKLFVFGKRPQQKPELFRSLSKQLADARLAKHYGRCFRRRFMDIVFHLRDSIWCPDFERRLNALPEHCVAFTNGLYDCMKGTLRDFRPSDYLTKTLGYNMTLKPDDEPPQSHYEDVIPDDRERRAYLQVFAMRLFEMRTPPLTLAPAKEPQHRHQRNLCFNVVMSTLSAFGDGHIAYWFQVEEVRNNASCIFRTMDMTREIPVSATMERWVQVNLESYPAPEGAIRIAAPMHRHPHRHFWALEHAYKEMQRAATRIQVAYRTWRWRLNVLWNPHTDIGALHLRLAAIAAGCQEP